MSPAACQAETDIGCGLKWLWPYTAQSYSSCSVWVHLQKGLLSDVVWSFLTFSPHAPPHVFHCHFKNVEMTHLLWCWPTHTNAPFILRWFLFTRGIVTNLKGDSPHVLIRWPCNVVQGIEGKEEVCMRNKSLCGLFFLLQLLFFYFHLVFKLMITRLHRRMLETRGLKALLNEKQILFCVQSLSPILMYFSWLTASSFIFVWEQFIGQNSVLNRQWLLSACWWDGGIYCDMKTGRA